MANWRVGASRSLGIGPDRAWDGPAAKGRVLTWAGFDGDRPDSARARRGFCFYDSEAANLKGSYKDGFADIVDGELVAIPNGVRQAKSRIPQTDGPAQAAKDRASAIMDAYLARINQENIMPDSDDRGVFAAPMAVLRILSPDDLTAAAKGKAPDPSVFEGRAPFLWRAEASNTRLDSYFTHMSRQSLQNYAADAEAGVSFQNSHRHFELPLGRSIAGQYVGPGGDGLAHMRADFFTLPGLNLNGVSTDDFVTALRAGIVRDVSIGFTGGKLVCDLDGEDYLRGNCRHILGLEYPGEGESKGKTLLATGTWDNARLSEVSAVYDGATPGATIISVKAAQEAAAGRLAPDGARLLEARYRIQIRGAAQQWTGWRAEPDEEESDMPPENERTPTIEVIPGNAGALLSVDRTLELLGTAAQALVTSRALLRDGETPIAALTRMADEAESLRALADQGRRYRTDLIEAALGEGVRAMGAEFPRETYRAVLDRSTIDEIKRFTADWTAIATRTLPGGRATVDGGADTEGSQPAPRGEPVAAYRV